MGQESLFPVLSRIRNSQKDFTYCGYGGISQPIVLSSPSAARNASANINLCSYQGGYVEETGSCVCLLLEQFSQVQFMKFQGSEALIQQNVAVLPEFPMLSHLELGLIRFDVFLGLLQRSPILKTLTFKGILEFDPELLNSTPVPDCFASTLQVVKFAKVGGYEHELCLAKYFMENGKLLERMSFSLASQALGKSKIMEEFKEKLFSFKKGFYFAIVEFSYD
ncbi:hypothetical protein QL285_033377 [Trifolium repens]|nr:hypothetical protein QL285_033377 [Trifolium repens]